MDTAPKMRLVSCQRLKVYTSTPAASCSRAHPLKFRSGAAECCETASLNLSSPTRRRDDGATPAPSERVARNAGQFHRSSAPGGGLRLPEPAGAAAARPARGHDRERRGGDLLRRRPRRRFDPLRRRHHGRAQVRLLYGLSRRHQLPGWWPLDRTRALRPRPRLHDPRRAKAGAPGRAASSIIRGRALSNKFHVPLPPTGRVFRNALFGVLATCRPIPCLLRRGSLLKT